MVPFTRFAYFTVARDASIVALAAGVLMLALSFEPRIAFGVGASVAMFFSLALLIRVCCLTERRFERCEPWRILQEDERPPGPIGRHWARAKLELMLLHSAKGAAAVAGVLYASALVCSVA